MEKNYKMAKGKMSSSISNSIDSVCGREEIDEGTMWRSTDFPQKSTSDLQSEWTNRSIYELVQSIQVISGTVCIRDWREETRSVPEGKLNKSLCWFYHNHPDGCPLSVCSFSHSPVM